MTTNQRLLTSLITSGSVKVDDFRFHELSYFNGYIFTCLEERTDNQLLVVDTVKNNYCIADISIPPKVQHLTNLHIERVVPVMDYKNGEFLAYAISRMDLYDGDPKLFIVKVDLKQNTYQIVDQVENETSIEEFSITVSNNSAFVAKHFESNLCKIYKWHITPSDGALSLHLMAEFEVDENFSDWTIVGHYFFARSYEENAVFVHNFVTKKSRSYSVRGLESNYSFYGIPQIGQDSTLRLIFGHNDKSFTKQIGVVELNMATGKFSNYKFLFELNIYHGIVAMDDEQHLISLSVPYTNVIEHHRLAFGKPNTLMTLTNACYRNYLQKIAHNHV